MGQKLIIGRPWGRAAGNRNASTVTTTIGAMCPCIPVSLPLFPRSWLLANANPRNKKKAIAVGAISVEADVWLYNDTLFVTRSPRSLPFSLPPPAHKCAMQVGHDTSSLTPNRTFDSLYIEPLVKILELQNPRSPFVPQETRHGVFDAAVDQPLFLWVDVKTDGVNTWPHVVRALEPLRSRDYLSTLTPTGLRQGPVTVIGTGNTPLELVAPVSSRDYFLDGPLLSLEAQDITKEISPIASAQLSDAVGEVGSSGLNATQVGRVKQLVDDARQLGIGVRFWDLPGWPPSQRNTVWKQLYEAGVYLINADDLKAVAALGGVGAEW